MIDLYAVGAGTPLDEDSIPRAINIGTGQRAVPGLIQTPNTYDFYATVAGERTIVAGPLTLDVARGDIIELILFDTVSPDVGELVRVPAP